MPASLTSPDGVITVRDELTWYEGNIAANIEVLGSFSTTSGYSYRTFNFGPNGHIHLRPAVPTNYTIDVDAETWPRYASDGRVTVGEHATVHIIGSNYENMAVHFEVYGAIKMHRAAQVYGVTLHPGSFFYLAPTDSVGTHFTSNLFCRDGASIVALPPPQADWPVPEMVLQSVFANFEPECRLMGGMRLRMTGGDAVFSSQTHAVENITMSGGVLAWTALADQGALKTISMLGGRLHFYNTEEGPSVDTLDATGGHVHLHGPSEVVNATLRSRITLYSTLHAKHTFDWLQGTLASATGRSGRLTVGQRLLESKYKIEI